MTWIEKLFPYRAHLEGEVEYLRAQLSQKQRRVDELQESLVASLNAITERARVKTEAEKKAVRMDPIPVQPKGWDAVRAWKKQNPEPEPDVPAGEQSNGTQG